MTSNASTTAEYIANLPDDRKQVITNLRDTFASALPKGFTEMMNYGMIGFVVDHNTYPSGYHCDPKLPLPFIGIASQKNHISIYHMGMYEGPLLSWFQNEWPKHSKKKLDMGKCCIRFKKTEDIPFALIEELASKLTPSDWIALYETNIKK